MTSKSTATKALALLAGSSMILSACATGAGSPAGSASSNAVTPSKAITWAYEQEFSSYNNNTADGNQAANAVVLNGVLSGFWQFKPDGTVQRNTEFGSFEKTSDTPLTVQYKINEKAVWSDGRPLDCDDIVLAWLANSGVTGEKGFSFSSNTGYEDMNKPQCKAGDKQFTVTYRRAYADWDTQFGPGSAWILPAHVVEAQAGMTKTFVDLADTPTSPDLAKAIEFYNKGWTFNPGELKKDITPSSGPYLIDSWTAGQSLTLKANPKWWGTPPKAATIVLRYISGPQQAQALQNGEVQVMDPQPQVDIINQLKAIGDKVDVTTSDQYTYEHVDYNFKGAFKDRSVREAFTKCLPRQQIVDNLIKPQNPKAAILQSRFVYPFQPAYSRFESGVGGEKYTTVDLAGAKTLLAGRTPTIRLGWRKDPNQLNKRRADTVALIKASCDQAGFKVVDIGSPTFFQKEWPQGNFDLAMFAWSGSPVVTGSNDIFTSDGGNNMQGYANPKVDKLITDLSAELDETKQLALLEQIDTLLWTDLVTVPLFAFPAVMAKSKSLKDVEFNATQSDLTWNVANWSLS